MPICPAGSQPRSGIPAFLALVGSALEFLLIKRAPWLAPFLILLSPFSVDTTAFCDEEPPPFPTWTAADLLGLLSGQSQTKLLDSVKNVAWYEFCECSGAATPAAPFQAPPADVPVVQPNTVGSCDIYHKSTDVNSGYFFGFVAGSPSVVVGGRPLPVGATDATLSIQVVSNPADDIIQLTLEVVYGDAANAVTGSRTFSIDPRNAPKQGSAAVVIPANSTQWVARFTTSSSQSGVIVLVADVITHCGAAPSRLEAPCCPPDPTLVAAVSELRELVTLIQRQGVPFAYVPGLTYAGLSGSGNVTFSDPILRAQLELTTLPGHYGMAEGEPDRLFDIGWLAIGTADGYGPTKRITHTPFLLPVTGDATKIGYHLAAGVVATLRTFSREP